MSPPNIACSSCGHPSAGDRKYCGGCGASLPASVQVGTGAGERFARHVETVARGGTPLGRVVDSLLHDADALGVTKAEAMTVIERLAQIQTAAPVRCWYDREQANAGVAGGSTLIAVRLRNEASRSIESVEVELVHPEDESIVRLPDIGLLTKDASRETETTLHVDRVGRHAIREGFITVRLLGAPPVCLRFNSALRLNADNSAAGRTNIHSVRQTIQTHGGGVISADGLQATMRDSADAWVEIPLVPADPAELHALRERATARMNRVQAPKDTAPPSVSSSATIMIPAPDQSPARSNAHVSVPPTVHIVNNIAPALSQPAVMSDKAVQTRSMAAVVITVVLVIGLVLVAILAALVSW